MNDFLTTMQSFCEKLLQQQQVANINQQPLHEMSLKEMEDLKQHYLDKMLSLSNDLGIKDYRNEKIDIRFRRECKDMIHELKGKFNGMSIEINKRKERVYLEQVANHSTISSQRFNSFCYDDADDYDYKESTIPLKDIISPEPLSNVITISPPVLPIKDPEDSLIMGNEELNTILEKESDEFIKYSVEDLIPIPNPAMSVASILEGFTDEPPLKENDDLFDLKPKNDDWKKILYDAPILMTEDKIFDPGIHDQNFSPTY
nr:hypothetical protein [Tanacetum cinerariifolium]